MNLDNTDNACHMIVIRNYVESDACLDRPLTGHEKKLVSEYMRRNWSEKTGTERSLAPANNCETTPDTAGSEELPSGGTDAYASPCAAPIARARSETEQKYTSALNKYMQQVLENGVIEFKRAHAEKHGGGGGGGVSRSSAASQPTYTYNPPSFIDFVREKCPENIDDSSCNEHGELVPVLDSRFGAKWRGAFERLQPTDPLHELGDIPRLSLFGTRMQCGRRSEEEVVYAHTRTATPYNVLRVLKGWPFSRYFRSSNKSNYINGNIRSPDKKRQRQRGRSEIDSPTEVSALNVFDLTGTSRDSH
jgi:hypothetical protein